MSALCVVLLILSVVCYIGQGIFLKMYTLDYKGPVEACSPVFSIIYGVTVSAATFAYNGFSFHADKTTLIMGLINGAALFLYNYSCIQSDMLGPYAFMTLLRNFGAILLPMAVAVTYWRASVTVAQLIGVMLSLVAIAFYSGKIDKSSANLKYLFWVFMVFLSNGIYGIFIDAQSRAEHGAMRNEMIITLFLSSAIFSAIHFMLTRKSGLKASFAVGKHAFIFAMLCCLCATVAINIWMKTLTLGDSVILIPTKSVLTLIGNMLLSVVLLKETINRRQWICIALSVGGLVLLNI